MNKEQTFSNKEKGAKSLNLQILNWNDRNFQPLTYHNGISYLHDWYSKFPFATLVPKIIGLPWSSFHMEECSITHH